MTGYWDFPERHFSFRHPGTGAAGIRDLLNTVRQFLHKTEIKKIPDIFFENSGMTKMVKIAGRWEVRARQRVLAFPLVLIIAKYCKWADPVKA